MKICLTTFYTHSYEPLAAITIPLMQKYCDKHGYFLNINKIPDGNFHFIKTIDTRKLLDEYDVVMGIECDVLITNPEIKVESFLDAANHLYVTTDVNNINFGVFIAKSSMFTINIFDDMNFNIFNFGDEQNYMERFAPRLPLTKICEHPCFNSIPYPYYEPSYGRIGYKDGDIVEVPKESEGNWERNHFVCHLPGFTMERRIEIFNAIKMFI